MTTHCLPPVADKQSRILILGSMPGKESLRRQQYYGHRHNAFWKLMHALLREPYVQDYQARLDMLLKYGIALWDVIKSCERKSSLDAHIRNPVVNDFGSFFAEHTKIAHVFFNGAKACDTFMRYAGREFAGLSFTRLGSTSPAHTVPFDERRKDWQRILPYLEGINHGSL